LSYTVSSSNPILVSINHKTTCILTTTPRGHPGDEVQDTNYAMNNPRRRSNSSSHSKLAKDFKTKFEIVEAEPVFEMSEHGPLDEDLDHVRLEHQSTTSSSSEAQSIEEEQN
jgi:hypothetical protein